MDDFYLNIIKVYELINKGEKINSILDCIYKSFKKFIPYDRICIALLDFNEMIYSFASQAENQALLNEGHIRKLSEISLNDIIVTKSHRIINNYEDYHNTKPDSESARRMLDKGLKSSIAYTMVSNEKPIGVLFFSSYSTNVYNESHVEFIKPISQCISIFLEKSLFVEDLLLGSITGFAKLVEAKDSDTGIHIERMQSYAKVIAESLSSMTKYKSLINRKYIDDIYKFSPLHDIGKVGIADGILLKPTRLTAEEFEVMKMHTIIGADVLRKSNSSLIRKEGHLFDMGIEIALGHHEKYNGLGYPYGIKGGDIPLSARIAILADVFDALTSKRVYKNAFDVNDSLQFVKDESGSMFDPDVVSALFDAKEDIMGIYNKFREKIDLSNI